MAKAWCGACHYEVRECDVKEFSNNLILHADCKAAIRAGAKQNPAYKRTYGIKNDRLKEIFSSIREKTNAK